MADPRALIQGLHDLHAQAKLDDVGSFQKLTHPLQQLSDGLRETYQASFRAPVETAIAKLRAGVQPAPEEMELVRGFMVGDAEAYIRLENDFQSWVAELARVVEVLTAMSGGLQGKSLLDALGEVEDARRVLGDICNYLEEKERVARFQRATSQALDPERAQILAGILREKLDSIDD